MMLTASETSLWSPVEPLPPDSERKEEQRRKEGNVGEELEADHEIASQRTHVSFVGYVELRP